MTGVTLEKLYKKTCRIFNLHVFLLQTLLPLKYSCSFISDHVLSAFCTCQTNHIQFFYYIYGISLFLSLVIKVASLTFSNPKIFDVILSRPIAKPPCLGMPNLNSSK